MKKITLLLIAIIASSACQKKAPTPVAEDNAAAIKAEQIAAEIKDMEQQEDKLRREIELEKLAMEREDLRRQREELETKSRNLSADELALEKKKTELAEQRVNDALEKVNESKTPLRAEPVDLPDRQSPSFNQPVSVNTNDYDYSVFYNRLSSYGSWFNSPQYGYIWQPSNYQASREWRPYTNGHWVYSNFGWTWVSSEPFGWATYHYGRWVLLRNTGWCWVPGNQWAPAWVAWRNNGSYVGWAPLPPETLYFSNDEWSNYYGDSCGISPRCFTFVRGSHFGSTIISNVYSVSDCVQLYQQTSYVGGYRYQGRQVICTGISYQFACQAIGRDLPRYECEFDGHPPTTLDPLRYVATRGNRLQINAPSMGSAWNSALRPEKFEKSLDNDQVVREANINERVLTGFSSARKRDREVADTSLRGGLAQKMSQRIVLEEKIAAHRGELAEGKNEPKQQRSELLPPVVEPVKDTTVEDEKSDRASGLKGRLSHPSQDRGQTRENQLPSDQAKNEQPKIEQPKIEQPRREDPKRVEPPVAPVEPAVPNETAMKDRPRNPDQAVAPTPETVQPDRGGLGRLQQQRDRLQQEREQKETALRQQQEQAAMTENQRQISSKEQEKAMREQQKVAAEAEKEQRKAQEKAAEKAAQEQAQQEKMKEQQQTTDLRELRKRQQDEADAAKQSEKNMRQQQDASRDAQQQAQQEAAREALMDQKRQQQLAEREQQMKAQQEAALEAQQQAQQEQMKAQQEAAREAQQQAQQEQMKAQQEAAREAQQQAQQEQMKAQQEAAREAQQQAQQEQMRQQQEAAREAQQQAQQEQMRQQQEAAREAQQQAREQQMRQQQEAAREAQQQAQQEQIRQQQQDAAREQQMRQQQQESARQQQLQQVQMRQQQDAARESQQNQLREQKRQEQQQQSQQQPRDFRRSR